MNINFNRKRKDPTREGQMQVRYAPGKRKIANLKWRLTLLLVLSPFLYFVAKLIISFFIAPASGFVMLDVLRYHAPADCVVEKLSVSVGQTIDTDDILAVLKDFELDAQIDELQEKLKASEIQLSADSVTEQYLEKKLQLALEEVRQKQEKFTDVEFLFNQGAATLPERTTAMSQLSSARSTLLNAEFEFQVWQKNNSEGNKYIHQNKASRDIMQAINRLEEKRNRLTIKALDRGRVTEIFISEGQILNKTDQLFAAARQNVATILAYIKPDHGNRVHVGDDIVVQLPSGQKLKARVQENPGVTGRLPSYLASPMIGRQRMIVIYLKPQIPLPANEMVDGLPVKVYFNTPGMNFVNSLSSFLNI